VSQLDRITELAEQLAPARAEVVDHPVYDHLHTLPAVRVFMEHHVFAVLDFMTLLKSLQRDLTCTALPWIPRGDPATRRLINEIVLAEECDQLDSGRVLSHFEMYLLGMEQAGADTRPARLLLRLLDKGASPVSAVGRAQAPEPAARFFRVTWSTSTTDPLWCRAAVFAFSREEVIPAMFARAVDQLDVPELATFREYLRRHIELDSDEHGPAALRMVGQLCGDHPGRWAAARLAAAAALTERRQLWDGVASALVPASAGAVR
jgi:hypothetical protein